LRSGLSSHRQSCETYGGVRRTPPLPMQTELAEELPVSSVTASDVPPVAHGLPYLVMKTRFASVSAFGSGRSASAAFKASTVSGQRGHRRGMPVFGRAKSTQSLTKSTADSGSLPQSELPKSALMPSRIIAFSGTPAASIRVRSSSAWNVRLRFLARCWRRTRLPGF
jgi:hypothetical protein